MFSAKKYLAYTDCLALKPVERRYFVNKTDINPATGKAYAINPQSGVWDDNYWAKTVDPQVNGTKTTTGSSSDPIALATQAQKMQVDANQPAIQTLTTQKTDLDSKYKDLLDSITASEQPALDATTLATNNELGRRGITSDSGVAQSAIADAIAPVTTQFGQLKANTGVAQQQDLGNIASAIAALQAGNVPNALSFGSNIAGQQQAATQFAQNLDLQNRQLTASTTANQPSRYVSVGADGLLDTQTGQVVPGVKAASNLNNNTGW